MSRLQIIANPLIELVKHKLSQILDFVLKSPKIVLGLSAVFFLISIVSLYFWWDYTGRVKQRIESTFRAKLDNTVWQHHGISAFLLSGISNIPLLEETKVEGQDLGLFFERIKADLSTRSNNEKTEFSANTNQIKKNEEIQIKKIKEIIADLGLAVEGFGKPLERAITSSDKKEFFVFLPAIKLNLTKIKLNDEKNNEENKEIEYEYLTLETQNLAEILRNNPEILSDLEVASKIKDLTIQNNKFVGVKINNIDIAQVYFISQSGLMLIISPKETDQGAFYKSKFTTYYNFPDRAYFWDAISNQKDNTQQIDYASEPYIDLGGNGLVRTFSKALTLPNNRPAVICFDTKIGNLEEEIQTRVAALDGTYGDFTYNSKGTTFDEKDNKIKKEFEWFEINVRKLPDKLTGRIADESSFNKVDNSVIRFTIPLSTTVGANNLRETKLMWVKIDLSYLETKQSALLTSGIFCLFISAMFLFFRIIIIYQSNKLEITKIHQSNKLETENNKLLNNEINNFAKRLDDVMEEAETPYVRLNNMNEFEYANKSFLTFLDYPSITFLKENKKIFRDLLGHDSQRLYDRIIKESREGKPTNKYEADLIKRDGSMIKVTLKGERIAFVEVDKELFPHRFGIIISPKPAVPTEAETKPLTLTKRISNREQ